MGQPVPFVLLDDARAGEAAADAEDLVWGDEQFAEGRWRVDTNARSDAQFSLEQMLVGFVTSTDGKQVLAYAAHRRRFTTEESFAWPEDCQVVPEFLALCGHRAAADGVIVHRGEARLTALAWKAGEELPAAIAVAELADTDEAGLAKEAAARAGLGFGSNFEKLATVAGFGHDPSNGDVLVASLTGQVKRIVRK